MPFRWDWVQRVAPVPYVPTIGPVHPRVFGVGLFCDVFSVAEHEAFLDYDKDRRWFDRKDETVLCGAVEHDSARTLIPTLRRRGGGSVVVYAYGTDVVAEATEMAADLAAAHRAARARVVTFQGPAACPPEGAASVRVQLWENSATHVPEASRSVRPVDTLSELERATFVDFAQELLADGFGFLHQQIEATRIGPVLAVIEGGRVVGAIGPLEVISDASGAAQLLPAYLGVLAAHRHRGHGRALWRAAMKWGIEHGAVYQVLQTAVDGSSDRLGRSEGLRSLGLVSSIGYEVS
jgi:GNAT superfamily N-acetyltransferase